jgi:penicillin-binding protein 2
MASTALGLKVPPKLGFRREGAGFRPRMRGVEIRNLGHDLARFQWRLVICAGGVLFLFFLLLLRFLYLQVVQHEHYLTLAENNRISVLPVIPNRGLILDRNGVVLAHNYSAYTLEITPKEVESVDQVIDALAEIVDIQPKDRKRFRKLQDERHDLDSLPIRTRLSDEEVARFSVNRYRFPGVHINARLFRHYPGGELASHVIGYIGRISERDKARLEEKGLAANYSGSDYIGKTGLEGSYENDLHGTTGFEQVETDAGGRAVRTLRRILPVSGNNLHLAIDLRLQEVAERMFGKRRGALVAIEPSTGGVMALVSKPGFDPNLFVEGIDAQNWDTLNKDHNKPLNNRALQGVYPPGSTFKPFMALAGLELGKRSASYTIADPGYFTLGGSAHRYRDWKPGGHGMVDLHRSIVISCDTYYYGLANELGIDNIHRFIGQFGFGKPSGIDISGESTGLLPSQEWKQRRFKQKWFAGDTISVGIGQGYTLATPLQLAFATAVLANRQPVRGAAHHRGRTVLRVLDPAREPGARAERDDRREQAGRHGVGRVLRCAVRGRRQDRDGPGHRHEAEREVRRVAHRGASPGPRAVHRLRTGRGAQARARDPRGERRARRFRGRAHRAGGVRLPPARQGADAAQGSRADAGRRGARA